MIIKRLQTSGFLPSDFYEPVIYCLLDSFKPFFSNYMLLQAWTRKMQLPI